MDSPKIEKLVKNQTDAAIQAKDIGKDQASRSYSSLQITGIVLIIAGVSLAAIGAAVKILERRSLIQIPYRWVKEIYATQSFTLHVWRAIITIPAQSFSSYQLALLADGVMATLSTLAGVIFVLRCGNSNGSIESSSNKPIDDEPKQETETSGNEQEKPFAQLPKPSRKALNMHRSQEIAEMSPPREHLDRAKPKNPSPVKPILTPADEIDGDTDDEIALPIKWDKLTPGDVKLSSPAGIGFPVLLAVPPTPPKAPPPPPKMPPADPKVTKPKVIAKQPVKPAEPKGGIDNLLTDIRKGKTLKPVDADPKQDKAEVPDEPKSGINGLLADIRKGKTLKPVDADPKQDKDKKIDDADKTEQEDSAKESGAAKSPLDPKNPLIDRMVKRASVRDIKQLHVSYEFDPVTRKKIVMRSVSQDVDGADEAEWEDS